MRWLPGYALAMLAGAATSVSAAEPDPAQAVDPNFHTLPVPAEPDAIPLRPPVAGSAAEQWERYGPTLQVRNVVNPTLTPFLPDRSKATGAAVIVAPGGAFRLLAIEHEGTQVARWLANHGIAAFVLKYRLVPTPRDPGEYAKAMVALMKGVPRDENAVLPATPEATEDALAAVALVRARAAEWHVDPHKVGMVGFSAGAMTTLAVGLAPEPAARPDFIAPLYPPMTARPVPADAPPMFVGIALDDSLFGKGRSLGLLDSWRQAGRPIEAHFYEKGEHGFGMAHHSHASALWPDEFLAWMEDRGIVAPR